MISTDFADYADRERSAGFLAWHPSAKSVDLALFNLRRQILLVEKWGSGILRNR